MQTVDPRPAQRRGRISAGGENAPEGKAGEKSGTGFLNRENQQRPRINTGREQDTAAGFTDEGK
jgi:hypothetical protein